MWRIENEIISAKMAAAKISAQPASAKVMKAAKSPT